jgi:hypothetical protein
MLHHREKEARWNALSMGQRGRKPRVLPYPETPDRVMPGTPCYPAAGGRGSDYAIVSVGRQKGLVTVRQPIQTRSRRLCPLYISHQLQVGSLREILRMWQYQPRKWQHQSLRRRQHRLSQRKNTGRLIPATSQDFGPTDMQTRCSIARGNGSAISPLRRLYTTAPLLSPAVCSSGQYQSTTGASTCTVCQAGTYSSGA